MIKRGCGKSGQVWIETVIYTLIALAMIGLVLAFAKPKIDSIRDQLVIEQTIDSMTKISNQIYDVQLAPQNKRVLNLKITKGTLFINPEDDSITWSLDSKYKYSEVDKQIAFGNLYVLTEQGNPYSFSVFSNYSVDLTLNGNQQKFEYQAAPSPYTVVIENQGLGEDRRLVIDIQIK